MDCFDYIFERCPYCHTKVWGTERDIDSGLRKHIDNCPDAPIDLAEDGNLING